MMGVSCDLGRVGKSSFWLGYEADREEDVDGIDVSSSLESQRSFSIADSTGRRTENTVNLLFIGSQWLM